MTDGNLRSDHEHTPVRRALQLGGSAINLVAGLIDSALVRAADVVADAERAFRQGLDPNVEDAKILEEYDRNADRA